MNDIKVIDVGEDGGRWLVTNTTDPNEARIAVVRHLREQLLPNDHEVFAGEVEELLDATERVYHYPLCADPSTERLYHESPVGSGAIRSDRIGGNGITFGVSPLPDQREMRRARR
ncbi:hypothetical protein ATK74_1787 [Propionicimonas paludicola]|uniref:Uncharacterized protein n=1 Tax=Propionicimonas paludicola TaxID=185243 RepID=A0A2A9CS16_9ACTN|nr:hypothetical protein [Propionicimonas paludicola]PFG17224.1 hypothetical protein ATK74_1787 [Propionicimonas paludicola]